MFIFPAVFSSVIRGFILAKMYQLQWKIGLYLLCSESSIKYDEQM